MARANAELLSDARELERRDSAIARELEALGDVAERVSAVRERASKVRAALTALPGELDELARRLGSARTDAEAAKETLASADERVAALARSRRSKQDDLDRAEREATTARQLLVDAESEVARVGEQIDELRASEPALRKDARTLVHEAEGLAGELAQLPRISESEDLRPGDSLEELEQWGLLARSALLVSRGTLEAEHERLVLEANELAALVLGDSSAGSSVTLVRRRLRKVPVARAAVERAAATARKGKGVRRPDGGPLGEPVFVLRVHQRSRVRLGEPEADAERHRLLEREALRHAFATLAAEVDGLVRQNDERLSLTLARLAVRQQVVERAADARIEVRDARSRKRDAQRVAPCAGEVVLLVAAERHRPARNLGPLRREALHCRRPLVPRERLPRPRAVGARREREQDDHGQRTHDADDPAALRRLRPGRGWNPVNSVLVLHELAEPEVGVLRPRRRPATPGPARLAPPAQHELDLRGEENDEREPERHPPLEPVDEEPREDEDERCNAHARLERRAAAHAGGQRSKLQVVTCALRAFFRVGPE